jgi:hypothetical protein
VGLPVGFWMSHTKNLGNKRKKKQVELYETKKAFAREKQSAQ